MDRSVGIAPLPPLPYRARPPQVLLAVGAVLVVSAGAAVASAYGGSPARVLLLALAVGAAGFSLRAARSRLGSSAETLAACAAALALTAGDLGATVPGAAAVLSVAFLVLHRAAPRTAVWPLAAWAAAQIAVLRNLDAVPTVLRTEALLCVALLGLGVALFARPLVARLVMVTTAPWWAAGVLAGSRETWTAVGAAPWIAATLMVGAAAGLLVARLREPLDVLLGPPRVVPVVSGAVAGAALAGASSTAGPTAVTLAGYLGVLTACLAAGMLTGWRRGLFLPVALSGGIVLIALSVARLVGGGRWSELSLLLLLTAAPTVYVAVRRPDGRPVTLPVAIGCLAGAALFALPDGVLTPFGAAIVLTGLYGVAMTVGAGLDHSSRSSTARAAALCALAMALLLRVEGEQTTLAAFLVAQGAFTLFWAWRTARPLIADRTLDPTSTAAWRAGAVQLVVACWIFAAAADLTAVEWYSLPAAAGLLIAAGPHLVRGRSWPAWGPALLMAAAPSTVLAVTTSDGTRAVGVLVVAAAVLVAGARTGVQAPLMIGAGTLLALALGLAVRALPWPLAAALVVGTALLALGMRRERRPIAGFGARIADLR